VGKTNFSTSCPSPLQEVDEPSGTNHFGSPVLGQLPQGAISRHECDRRGGFGDDGEEHVVATPEGVEDGHAVGHTWFGAPSSFAFEDNDSGFLQHARSDRSTNSRHERSGRPWSIFPPAGGAGANHVRRVDQEHVSILTTPEESEVGSGM
jgi:hypothetical protein